MLNFEAKLQNLAKIYDVKETALLHLEVVVPMRCSIQTCTWQIFTSGTRIDIRSVMYPSHCGKRLLIMNPL